MKLAFAVPVLGALALVAALPDAAEARSRSSFDVSVGFGYSSYGGDRHHHGGSHYGGSHYGGHSYYRSAPRYYSPRPYYRDSYYSRPVHSYRYDDSYYRPVYRPRYYYRDSYYCD